MYRLTCLIVALLIASMAHAETITVAAAASLREALTGLTADFKKSTGIDAELVFGSSGQLAQQIANGAPADVFIPAASKQVDDLLKAGLLDAASRRTVAGNRLVLIVPADAKTIPKTLEELVAPAFKRIAVGEPKTVPAGQYAEQTLTKAGILSRVADRLTTATNVRQVLTYVERGEVSAGFVYASDARQSGDKVHVALTVPQEMHEPIVYPAALIAATKRRAEAQQFLDFLMTEPAQKRFQELGFGAPPPAPEKESAP